MDILMVLSSHDSLGGTGRKTGMWFDGFAAPYYVLRDAGAEITLASPEGGPPPINPFSYGSGSDSPAAKGDAVARFKRDMSARMALADTLRLSQVYPADFDAVFYPGGYGALWDLAADAQSIALIAALHAARKPVALVCHGPAALLWVQDADGRPLVAGKNVTAFANSEQAAVGLTTIVPFSLQDALVQLGARYSNGPNGCAHVVRDGTLITGQNAASAADAAHALLDMLSGGTPSPRNPSRSTAPDRTR